MIQQKRRSLSHFATFTRETRLATPAALAEASHRAPFVRPPEGMLVRKLRFAWTTRLALVLLASPVAVQDAVPALSGRGTIG